MNFFWQHASTTYASTSPPHKKGTDVFLVPRRTAQQGKNTLWEHTFSITSGAGFYSLFPFGFAQPALSGLTAYQNHYLQVSVLDLIVSSVFCAAERAQSGGTAREVVTPHSPEPSAVSALVYGTTMLTAAQLHARHLDDVYRYVARRMAGREDAEDITAEVFAAAFEALPGFRGDVEPRLWLLGIARRKVADALRRGRTRRTASWDEINEDSAATQGMAAPRSTDPARIVARQEAAATMRRVLASLKDEQREALLLKYVEELSTEEIAVVLGRSPAAVNSLLQRARATALREGRAYFHDFLADVSSPTYTNAISREVQS